MGINDRMMRERHQDYISYLEAERDRLSAENVKLRQALTELVALNDTKTTQGQTEQYKRRKPLAWDVASSALKKEKNK